MKRAYKVSTSLIVPIVHDGAIATQKVGEGRMIPVLIVDCSEKVELRDLIYAHEDSGVGDVTITWATERWKNDKILLQLEFSRPSSLKIILEFNITKQGGVIDSIFHANALYLQAGEPDSKIIDGLNGGNILVEVPDTGFFSKWDSLYTKAIVKKFKKSGFSKSEAKKSTEEFKSRLREMWIQRVGSNN